MAMYQKLDERAGSEGPSKRRVVEVEEKLPGRFEQAVWRMSVARPRRASPGAVLGLQRAYGNRAVAGLIQAKLLVGPAGDEYEREADRVAERVVSPGSPAAVQRQAVSPDGAEEADAAIEERLNRLRGSGEPLPPQVRAEMESHLGVDLSGVRVHADAEAAHLSRELRAQAFTSGRDVYFGAGRYDPASAGGRKLLAHELTHVVQQRGRRMSVVQRKKIWEQNGMTEEEWNNLSDSERIRRIRGAVGQQSTPPSPPPRPQRTSSAQSTPPSTPPRPQRTSSAQSTQSAPAVSTDPSLLEDSKAEKLGELAGHWGFASAGLGLGVLGDTFGGIEEYQGKDWAGTTSAGFGIAGGALETLGGLAELSGNVAGFSRGRQLYRRGGGAGRLLGRRMMKQTALGGVQNLVGVGTGLAGMVSGGAAAAGKDDLSERADAASAGLQIAGESIGMLSGAKSLWGAFRRSKKAKEKAQSYSSDEMKNLAEFVSSSQGKGSKTLGILSNIGGIVGGGFRLAGGKTGLIGGAVSGGIGSLLGIGQSVYAGKKQKKAEAQAGGHIDYLVSQLSSRNAEAVSFANEVLKIKGSADELKEMADSDTDALRELLMQKMVKYD